MTVDIAKRQADRLRLIRAIFDAADGMESEVVRFAPTIQRELGLTDQELANACNYLIGEGLINSAIKIEQPPVHIAARLTHRGIIEIEQSMAEPSKPTEHLPAAISPAISVVSIRNSTVIGSPIQSASPGAHQETLIDSIEVTHGNDIPGS